MARQWTFLGYELTRSALIRGASVSGAITLGFGAIIGRWVDDGSWAGVGIGAIIIIGLLAGGFVAGRLARSNHVVHGFLSSVPTTALAFIVTVIRAFGDRSNTSVLGLIATTVLAGSLGTLGGLIGSRFSPARRSLLR